MDCELRGLEKSRGQIRKFLKASFPIVLVVIAVVCSGFGALAKEELLRVIRVIDGDTIELSNGKKVRLIGVDTPELHYSKKLLKDARKNSKDIRMIQELGERSTLFTSDLCLGKKVKLEYDVEKKDKYGRTLAYVYLEDGTFINAKILQEGYGQMMTIPPNVKYADNFLKLQEDAKRNNRGLWEK